MNFKSENIISRNQLCPCGSNIKYKNCHGSLAFIETSNQVYNDKINEFGFYSKNLMSKELNDEIKELPSGIVLSSGNIPPGFYIIENFLDLDLCQNLISHTEQSIYRKAKTVAPNQIDKNFNNSLDESTRNTEVFDLGKYNDSIKLKLLHAFDVTIKNHYKQEVSWFEEPNLLRYKKGGFYAFHADSDNWHSESKCWKRSIERDFSFILFLNDDYTGGELVFPNFNFQFKPKRGMLICFPSDHRFMHKVKKTLSGIRYSIVTWAAIKGTKKVKNSILDTDQIIKL